MNEIIVVFVFPLRQPKLSSGMVLLPRQVFRLRPRICKLLRPVPYEVGESIPVLKMLLELRKALGNAY